ncbi:hypothetical protein [Legionella sp. W05-934-2]|jgi:hypothetical protein|uniref:hypothetical protein n=1 Tax=Legionella sp. W05-934-2 TaxID=1198649 RepID=UPI0034621F69
MDKLRYWTGKDTKYKEIWDAYNDYVEGYSSKIMSVPNLHLIIEFEQPNLNLPLLNAEAVFKTIQGLFHDFKYECLEKDEYQASTPISLYSIDRGSAIWDFLISNAYIIPIVYSFSYGIVKFKGALLDNRLKKLQIQKLESELEQLNQNRKKDSKSEISKNSLDKFIEKHSLPIENLVNQNIKSIKVTSMENMLGLDYYSRTEVISLDFSETPKDIDGPNMSK